MARGGDTRTASQSENDATAIEFEGTDVDLHRDQHNLPTANDALVKDVDDRDARAMRMHMKTDFGSIAFALCIHYIFLNTVPRS